MKLNRFFALFIFILGFSICVNGQKKKTDGNEFPTQGQYTEYIDTLKKMESQLQLLSDSLLDAKFQGTRIKTLTRFIPMFVKALKVPGSYNYPFDSLKFVKKLSPPDNTFRLFNWTLKYDDGSYRYYGAIQFNRLDSLKLVPLRDYREKLDTNVENIVVGPEEWVGAQYYSIFPEKWKGKTYYMLLGWDGDQYISDKKVIDVLTFEGKRPVFGAPVFEKDGQVKNRIVFQFSGNATMLLQYIPDHNIITLDHMVPPNPSAEGVLYTYIPDGTYDYFVWDRKKGRWVWQEELFENYKKPIKEAGDNGYIENPKKR